GTGGGRAGGGRSTRDKSADGSCGNGPPAGRPGTKSDRHAPPRRVYGPAAAGSRGNRRGAAGEPGSDPLPGRGRGGPARAEGGRTTGTAMMFRELFFLSGYTLLAWTVVTWLALFLAMLVAGFPRLNLRQVAGIVLVAAWVCALFASAPWETERLIFLTVVAVRLGFAGMWIYEFRALMLRRDDEFPGRFDKLVWALALLVFAPAGVWLFRLYRKAQWPDAPRAGRAPAGAPPDTEADLG